MADNNEVRNIYSSDVDPLNFEDAKRVIIDALKNRYDNFEHYELDEISKDEITALQIVSGLESGELNIFENTKSTSNDLVEVILPLK